MPRKRRTSGKKRPITAVVADPNNNPANPTKQRKQSDKMEMEESASPEPVVAAQPDPEEKESELLPEETTTAGGNNNDNRNQTQISNEAVDIDVDSDLAPDNDVNSDPAPDLDVDTELATAIKHVSLEPTVATGHRFRSKHHQLSSRSTRRGRGRPSNQVKHQNVTKARKVKSNKVVSQDKMGRYFELLKSYCI